MAAISALVSLPRGGIPKAAFAERVAADTAREKARGLLDCAGHPVDYRWRCRPSLLAQRASLSLAVPLGKALGQHHVELLCGAYVVRQLQRWFENLGKRVVKSPKVHVRDSM